MTTIEIWIDAQLCTLKNNLECLQEIKEDMGKLIIQLWVIKKHIDSTLEFLERQGKFK